jgi:hypothetical protein
LIFTKTLAGLRIQSDIALPDLPEPDATSPEFGLVRIRIVDIEELIFRRNRAADDRNFALNLPGIGEFLVPGPHEILVAPDAQAAERAIVWFLLGPCFAAIAYWNRVLPLHAGAIDTPEGCIAFAGNSGAGKSTLVHRFIAEGYPVRSDDVCFVRPTDDGQIMVWPGVRLLRLVDKPAANGVPTGKQCLALPPLAHPTQPVRLRAVYVLRAAAGATTGGEIARLWGARAAEQLIANAYRIEVAARLGLIAKVVPGCVNVAGSTPVYRYSRALGFDAFPESLRRLTAHFSTRAD